MKPLTHIFGLLLLTSPAAAGELFFPAVIEADYASPVTPGASTQPAARAVRLFWQNAEYPDDVPMYTGANQFGEQIYLYPSCEVDVDNSIVAVQNWRFLHPAYGEGEPGEPVDSADPRGLGVLLTDASGAGPSLVVTGVDWGDGWSIRRAGKLFGFGLLLGLACDVSLQILGSAFKGSRREIEGAIFRG